MTDMFRRDTSYMGLVETYMGRRTTCEVGVLETRCDY